MATYRAETISPAHVVPPLRIAYRETLPTDDNLKGTVLLVHGFPQTSYQFRHVMPLLSAKGYRCIAPDYRGAGRSSKPNEEADFRKATMAGDLVSLLDVLGIKNKVHVVGHDIGGMVAYALVSRWPERVATATWGECPMPGTLAFTRDTTDFPRVKQQFHWVFHAAPEGLAEMLVSGKEREYLEHFFFKIGSNLDAFGEADIEEYTRAYSQPGAMRCAMAAYRALEQDAKDNKEWLRVHGKGNVPTMCLSGELSRLNDEAAEMAEELVDPMNLVVKSVPGSNHYIAEENPQGFVSCLLDFWCE